MVINKLDYFGIVILNTNVEIIFEFAKNHIVSIEQNMGAASLGRKKLQHDIVVSKIMRIFDRLIMNKLLILHIYETETKLREHGSIG